MQMLESALQLIIHFCSVLSEMPPHPKPQTSVLVNLIEEDEVWEQLTKLSTELKHRTCAFYKTLKYRANRGECTEGLYVMMSFNTYYTSLNN